MQDDIDGIANLIADRMTKPVHLKSVKYAYRLESDFGDSRGPGLVAKFVTDQGLKGTGVYPIGNYPDLDTLKKAINFDAFFQNITFNYPHLGILSCDYALNVVRVDLGSSYIDIRDFRRFYDDEACVLHVDKFVQAVNEALQNRVQRKETFLHFKRKPEVFAPKHRGDNDIKAEFAVEQQAEKSGMTLTQ